MRRQVGGQVLRHLTVPGLLGRRPVVTGRAEQAGLVLHLDHDHGVVPIRAGQVGGQSHEGAAVRVHQLGGEHREDGLGPHLLKGHRSHLVPTPDHPWEARGVRAHPARRVGGGSVLEGAEPDEDQVQAAASGRLHLGVHEVEVEHPLLGLHEVPAGGPDDEVAAQVPDEVHGLGGRRRIRGSGVVELAAQEEARASVDAQMGAAVVPAQRGPGAGRLGGGLVSGAVGGAVGGGHGASCLKDSGGLLLWCPSAGGDVGRRAAPGGDGPGCADAETWKHGDAGQGRRPARCSVVLPRCPRAAPPALIWDALTTLLA